MEPLKKLFINIFNMHVYDLLPYKRKNCSLILACLKILTGSYEENELRKTTLQEIHKITNHF